MYSFGMVMWELLTGEEPYANLRSEEIIGITYLEKTKAMNLRNKLI